jgi:hypothetical protein
VVRAQAALCVFALAACSGGATIPGASPANATAPSTQQKAKATLTIRWASSENADTLRIGGGVRRRPHFISPSAQSIEIDVSADAKPSKYAATIVDRPKSGKLSTVAIDAPIGKDDFVFGVYDRPKAQGNLIGGAEVFQTIVAGKANVLKVTLDGYVDGAKLTYNSPYLVSTVDAGGQPNFTLVGVGSVSVSLTLTDVDGNVILPPGTAPVATLTSSQPSLVKVTSSGSNGYTVQAVASNPTGAVIGLQVQANSGASGSQPYETQFPLTESAAIYAAYGAGGSAGVTVFDQQGHTYTSTGFSGLNTPVAMTWDPVDKMVLVADAGNGGTLLAFDPAGNAAKGWTPPAVPGIDGVAYNPDTKQIYVTTTAGGGAVNAFNAQGSRVSLSSTAFTGLDDPIGIAYDSSAHNAITPTSIDEFYIVNKPSSGPAFLTVYVASGKPAGVPEYTFGSNDAYGSYVPTAIAPAVTNQYGVAPTACYIAANSGGTNNILFYGDNADSNFPPSAAVKIVGLGVTNAGLNAPTGLVLNPLANYTVVASNTPPLSGPQPVMWYAANASGGLIAILGDNTQQTSTTFPLPAGANNFAALTMTY